MKSSSRETSVFMYRFDALELSVELRLPKEFATFLLICPTAVFSVIAFFAALGFADTVLAVREALGILRIGAPVEV